MIPGITETPIGLGNNGQLYPSKIKIFQILILLGYIRFR